MRAVLRWSGLVFALAALSPSMSRGSPALAATFEILDPSRARGHRVLALGDLVGSTAEPKRLGFPDVQVVVNTRVTAADCVDREGLCRRLERSTLEAFDPKRVLPVALVVPTTTDPQREIEGLPIEAYRLPIALDRRGLSAHVLGLSRRGATAVVFADGRVERLTFGQGTGGAEALRRTIASGFYGVGLESAADGVGSSPRRR